MDARAKKDLEGPECSGRPSGAGVQSHRMGGLGTVGELGRTCFGEGVESIGAQLPRAGYPLPQSTRSPQDGSKISWVWLGSTDLGISVQDHPAPGDSPACTLPTPSPRRGRGWWALLGGTQ